ncbi:MAG: diphthine synthase [Thermocladium sp.]
MGFLHIIGMGLHPGHISLDALNAVRSSDEVFIELYTSKLPPHAEDELIKLIGRRPLTLARHDIEDKNGEAVMNALASGKSVSLLVIGDPLMATTHAALAVEASRRGHQVRIINSVSIVCAAFSQVGLSPYKAGPIATVTYERLGYRSKRHVDVMLDNIERGLHTLLLLDINDNGEFMEANYAAQLVAGDLIERGLDARRLMTIYLARVGWSTQKISVSTLDSPPDMGETPHSIMVPGSLNAVEEEFLLNVLRADKELMKKHLDFIKEVRRGNP